MKLNPNFHNLKSSYLFIDIARRLEAYKAQNPDADIIRLGIGDVTRPLAAPVVNALVKASEDQGRADTFHGYGPEQGYAWLREGIAAQYKDLGVSLQVSEIFVSDGAKSDIADILDVFEAGIDVLVPDPVYPAYVDANIMAGNNIRFVSADKQDGFLPMPNKAQRADLIYICSPNNPTGAAYTRAQLAEWVKYAYENEAVILFDAAYESFITDPDVPHSIYEVEGAKEVAVEICSLSKTAGFTGTRCGYTVVPKALAPGGESLNEIWNRRQTTRFNEVSYIVQRGAEAVFTPAGRAASMENVAYYKNNAATIAKALDEVGIWYCGGKNSPYIWLECPGGDSWAFFDTLLQKGGVVGTPGAGFGQKGEGYFRLTGFGEAARTAEAAERLKSVIRGL